MSGVWEAVFGAVYARERQTLPPAQAAEVARVEADLALALRPGPGRALERAIARIRDLEDALCDAIEEMRGETEEAHQQRIDAEEARGEALAERDALRVRAEKAEADLEAERATPKARGTSLQADLRATLGAWGYGGAISRTAIARGEGE